MQLFYFVVVDNIQTETITRELKEVADYVSDTFINLFLLANSSSLDVNLTKELDLPDAVHNRAYVIEIIYDEINGSAQSIRVYLRDEPSVYRSSRLAPGLKVDPSRYLSVEGRETLTAHCRRSGGDIRIGFGLSS